MKKPSGYGIVDVKTKEIYPIWRYLVGLFGVAYFCLCVFYFFKYICDGETKEDFRILVFGIVNLGVCVCTRVAFALVKYVVCRRLTRYESIVMEMESAKWKAKSESSSAASRLRRKDAVGRYELIVETNNGIPIVSGEFPCKRGEEVVYFERGVGCSEKRSSAGEMTWKEVDEGRLQVTNKRIIFIGDCGIKEIALKNVLEIQKFQDGVVVSASGRVRPILFRCDNGLLLGATIGFLLDDPDIKLIPEDLVVIPDQPKVEADCKELYIDSLIATADKIVAALMAISADVSAASGFKSLDKGDRLKDFKWFVSRDNRVATCVIVDLFRCFFMLGHSIKDLATREGLCLLVVLSKVFYVQREIKREEWKDNAFLKAIDKQFEPYIVKIDEVMSIDPQNCRILTCDTLLSSSSKQLSIMFAEALYEWAELVASVDGTLTVREGDWLGVIKMYCHGLDPSAAS